MDTTKQHQSPDGQDSSDDLIAELARLVAQDARSTSANSDAYNRVEPSFAAPRASEPVAAAVEPTPAQGWRAPEARFEAAPEPDLGYAPRKEAAAFHDREQEAGDAMPAFDSGFAHQPRQPDPVEPEYSDVDPIADLIAHAEEEDFAADSEDSRSETDDSLFEPSPPAPVRDEQDEDEQDNFGAPAFGSYDYEPRFEPAPEPNPYSSAHESHPVEPEPSAERDPLSEIEALIGEAARVNVAAGSTAGGRRVRSSFLGEDEEPEHADKAVSAAESAILAAAAATGAHVSRVAQEPSFAHDDAQRIDAIPDPLFVAEPTVEAVQPEFDAGYEDEAEGEAYPAERRRRQGGILIPAVAGAVILAALGGGYFAFFAGPADPTDAPVLLADGQPLKQDAEPTTNTNAASQSVVFNEIDGNTTPTENEMLVSRDQTDGATGGAVSSIIAPEEGEVGLANRPVRTVTVRPDGTIVMGEDSVAGSNVLPVDRPDVPAVPNSTLTADPIGEAIAAAIASGEVEAIETPVPAETVTPNTPVPAETLAVPETPAGAATPAPVTDENAPRPVPRPAGLSLPSASAQTPAPATQAVAAVQPIATPAPATTPTAVATPSTAGAWVQLSSQRSEEVARAGLGELQSRYGSLFNGASLEVSRVDLGDRGIYYRVRLPQPSMADANSVCNAIKGQGGDCFVLNN